MKIKIIAFPPGHKTRPDNEISRSEGSPFATEKFPQLRDWIVASTSPRPAAGRVRRPHSKVTWSGDRYVRHEQNSPAFFLVIVKEGQLESSLVQRNSSTSLAAAS